VNPAAPPVADLDPDPRQVWFLVEVALPDYSAEDLFGDHQDQRRGSRLPQRLLEARRIEQPEGDVEVEELVPVDDGAAEAAMRAALVDKYNAVRPFLKLQGESQALAEAAGGRKVLAAVRRLPELARRQVSRKPLLPKGIDASLVTAAWKRPVYANAGKADRVAGQARDAG
jgi:hypothetical protein